MTDLIYTQFYLGPYILVNRQKQDLEKSIYHCPNDKCSNHGVDMLGTMKYCYVCSERLGYKQYIDHNYLCTCEVIEDQNLLSVSDVKGMGHLGDGCRILLPDPDVCDEISCGRDMHFKDMDVSKGFVPKDFFETSNFCDKVSEELGKLKEAYGEENIKVLWGLINYE